MNKLIINTANDKLFIVLVKEDKVFSFSNVENIHHNEILIPSIDALIKEHNLDIENIDEFGVVIGPGSFTGIRVGIATIKAFRDALNKKAKGINNLYYLFSLAKAKNKNIDVVAICGSKDSYFVARRIHNQVYIYDRNLTCEEVKTIAGNKKIGMFKADENLDYELLLDDAEVLNECLTESKDESLLPVYYQLSQAENEKLKKSEIVLENANKNDIDNIYEIEKNSIVTNTLNKNQIEEYVKSENYFIVKATMDSQIVGYCILQKTDELNIDSIAVDKKFRNLGIATKLIQKAFEIAKKSDINVVSLEVNFNNIPAFLLYEKLGFVVRRTRKNYYEDGSDCLEMIKTLD